MEYNPREIERNWRQYWEENETYKVSNNSTKPKYYILDMFPYPSGAGLHVGHPLGYIGSDILARYKRLKGYNVLHPMGYDAFGLPAEQYAVETGIHPAISTAQNIERYRQQLDNLGFCFDWSREVQTCDPNYYKWTQWIFIQMFESWYDTNLDKAQPIADLIKNFETEGNTNIQAATTQSEIFSADDWAKMSNKAKDVVLMNYRLMYRKVSYVNWCEALGTVLANDEVVNGVSERGGFPVENKPMLQWSMRITAYAERLLKGLEAIDFSDSLKVQQRNWIGRSEGAQVFFNIDGYDEKLEIYTTRPDTIFGATFMVLAPEHDLVPKITSPSQQKDIDAYLDYVKSRNELERLSETKTTTGAFTGAYAINPFNGERLPIWISEYVLKGYGTGAIMAVPADDERDKRFAEKFSLPIIEVIDKSNYPGATIEDKIGKMINSDFLNGMEVLDAIQETCKRLEEKGIGKKKINYKLRDANYGRQRYWGEPFPIIYDADGVAKALPINQLPLVLPEIQDYKSGGGRGPLAKLKDWVNLANGTQRDTDTMPGFAGSSWYFLRYMDPENAESLASKEAINYWQDVDFYIGGAEHAVGHLMYSRMWHKFLHDLGIVPTEEPYKKLVNQGMIGGVVESAFLHKETKNFISAELVKNYNAEDLAEILVHAEFVTDYGDLQKAHLNQQGIEQFKQWRPDYNDSKFIFADGSDKFYLKSVIGKMSKRLYNVVNPDDVVEQYGADCFRLYEMFLGPIEDSKPWDTRSISGVSGFLRRFWSLFFEQKGGLNGDFKISEEIPSKEEYKILHTCIKKVTEDIERFSLNTAVSSFMICVNDLKKSNCNKRIILKELTILLAPFAPHIAEEMWSRLEEEGSVCDATYPIHNDEYLVQDTIQYPVSINGKKRADAVFAANANPKDIETAVLSMDIVQKWLEGQTIKKVIVVPGRMVNIVI